MRCHHVWLALPALDAALRDLPEHACRLIADREQSAAQGQPALLHVAPDVDAGVLASARIEPVVAGSGYLFGSL